MAVEALNGPVTLRTKDSYTPSVSKFAADSGERSYWPDGSGQPLPQATRALMEMRFGYDFGRVRIHTDSEASTAAHSLGAKAYTIGEHLIFGASHYSLGNSSGMRLLAHELAHVTQQARMSRPVIQRDIDPSVQEETPSPPDYRNVVDELDYAFVFTGGAYGHAAEAFIRRYYPEYRLVRAASFEVMFDRLYTDTRRAREGHRFHLHELVIVTHANAAGGMRIPLTRGDIARHRFFTIWDVDDVQEEFQVGLFQRFRQRRHEVVSNIIDENTSVVVRGCEFGQAGEALDVLRSLFGGQPTVWAPQGYQGYETIRIGSSLLRTPEEAFDFLVQQDFLPPEMMPAPNEDKRSYIARVFGLHGSIPAQFFVMGPEARARLGRSIAEERGISPEAEVEKVREPVTIPSGGEYWSFSSPGLLGDDAEFDRLSMPEIAQRAHGLMTPYRPENACTIARLRRAWERKETSDRDWMDYLMSETSDPLAGLPGETGGFFAYIANRFRENPSNNPYNGLPIENVFGDSSLIAMDASRYPCITPHEDIFETRMLEYEIPAPETRTEAGSFEEPLTIGAPPPEPPVTRQPPGNRGASETTREEILSARAHALDFSKLSTTPDALSLVDALQRLSNDDLVAALGLALEITTGGDRSYLTAVENEMLRRQLISPFSGTSVISMSEAEFEEMTGAPASTIPEQTALAGGAGASFIPEPLWYYRVLAGSDPSVTAIRAGADLIPRVPDPGYTFQPAASRAEMTFRHTRPGGNVPQVGTNRISTARALDAFETLLRERGTGEMVRVDVNAARRLGAEFLEHPEIQLDLDAMERAIQAELEEARATGRGRTYIARLESRLRALRAAREYTVAFQEGHGIGRIPSGAVTPVEGATLSEAVAAERALLRNVRYLRWGGRVFLVLGVGLSVHRVASATSDERPRIVVQEAGGWAFSLAGAWAGVKAGGLAGGVLGIESGPGLLVTGAIGAVIGGGIGFFVGEEIADSIYDLFN
jgi:hypothetical protein